MNLISLYVVCVCVHPHFGRNRRKNISFLSDLYCNCMLNALYLATYLMSKKGLLRYTKALQTKDMYNSVSNYRFLKMYH